MTSIQFGGVVSGLNTQSIIDAMVNAEKAPLTDLQNQEAVLTSQKTAYSQLGTAMDFGSITDAFADTKASKFAVPDWSRSWTGTPTGLAANEPALSVVTDATIGISSGTPAFALALVAWLG